MSVFSLMSLQEDLRSHRKSVKRLNDRVMELERMIQSSRLCLEDIAHKLEKSGTTCIDIAHKWEKSGTIGNVSSLISPVSTVWRIMVQMVMTCMKKKGVEKVSL